MTSPASIDTIDHIMIAVKDLAQAEEDYTKLLGRVPSWRATHEGMNMAHIIYRLANTYLELMTPHGAGGFGDKIQAHLDEKGEGLFGLAFGTNDVAGVAARLQEKGLTASTPAPREGISDAGMERRWINSYLPKEETHGLFLFITQPEDRLAIPYSPVAPGVSGRAAVEAIDHIVINTAEPDAAIAFFRDEMGLRLALDQTIEKWDVRQLFFRVGNLTLEIVTPQKKKRRAHEDDFFWGYALLCPDIQAYNDRFIADGGTVSDIRTGRKPGTLVATVKSGTLNIPTLLIGTQAQ